MIIPPFNDTGEGGAEFYCLAFAPIIYRQMKTPRLPAALGIYFCAHKDFTRFSQHSFDSDGSCLSYTRGDDTHDSLEFLLLAVLLESSVHPAIWKLFPRTQFPSGFNVAEYEAARRRLCLLLFHFRSRERAAKLTAKMGHEPLMVCDPAATRISFGEANDEDEEITRAIVEVG